ncbi:hypothetical protein BGZ54_002508 [Gamsiella multidivaricata]|nr:hypothetical protein BGZ54_002508 [Gamsiella multidivaricata]
MTHHDQTLYRESFYSGIGQENDWRQLEELDPDSLAGIHIYGDTSNLHSQLQRQPSPAAPSSPLNKYPTYEYNPVIRSPDWQQGRQLQQQQNVFRQPQCPDDEEDEFGTEMAARYRRGSPFGIEGQGGGEENQTWTETSMSKPRGNNRMKQIFKDVFGISSKKRNSRSAESPFRDISLPSTHIRDALTPSPHHQQHLNTSIHNQHIYSTTLTQRKGLVTPVSRPDTAQSNYQNDASNNNNGNINGRSSKNPRESLVDPVLPQRLGFQRKELEDDVDALLLGDQDLDDGVLQSPFAQTSLTPPPASSVLRHSASSHRVFNSGIGSGECEPILISAAATASEQPQHSGQKTRPSSQLMPLPKDFADSGCDSMGGHDHYATASNATTLNHNQTQSSQQQMSPSSKQVLYQVVPSYECDPRMTMSTYDNGPTIVSIGQMQKVDLEGLRQSHHHHRHHHQLPHHSSPTHSHQLNMVTVESPFA